MTSETMKLLVQSPELLNRISIAELRSMDLRAINDLPEPRLLVSELGPMGVTLGIVFPFDDYEELYDGYLRVFQIVAQLNDLLTQKNP